MQIVKLLTVSIFLMLLTSGCDGINETNAPYRPSSSHKESSRYVIGINAYLNSKQMFIAYRPILDYLEHHLEGVRFELATSKDFIEYEKRIKRNEFHFALSNPYQSLMSFDHHYYPVAKMKNDDVFRGLLIARKDSRIMNYRQLNGKVVSFSAPTALAGTLMTKYYLWEHGIDVRHDMHMRYVGSHYSAIMNTYTGDSFVAATWPLAWEEWKKENPDKANEMEIVWITEPLMNNAFVARSDVDPALVAKVTSLLLKMGSTQEGRELLKNAGIEGFEPADRKTFKPVEKFLKHYHDALGAIE